MTVQSEFLIGAVILSEAAFQAERTISGSTVPARKPPFNKIPIPTLTPKLEYHSPVRRPTLAPVAPGRRFAPSVFLIALLVAFSARASQAQINAPPTSVTSPGFGGRAVNGPPASVTSLGPNGYGGNGPRITINTQGSSSHEPHHHHHNFVDAPPVVYAVPVPYAVDMGAADDDSDDDADYQGGPTIFDRRGSGADSYIPPVQNVRIHHAISDPDPARTDPQPDDPPAPPTLLVFKDGHKIEVANYAVVGETLFDFTPGHARKVALADLDLEATRKQNDDRGIIFQLPATPQAN